MNTLNVGKPKTKLAVLGAIIIAVAIGAGSYLAGYHAHKEQTMNLINRGLVQCNVQGLKLSGISEQLDAEIKGACNGIKAIKEAVELGRIPE